MFGKEADNGGKTCAWGSEDEAQKGVVTGVGRKKGRRFVRQENGIKWEVACARLPVRDRTHVPAAPAWDNFQTARCQAGGRLGYCRRGRDGP